MIYHVMVLRNESAGALPEQPPAWHRERQLPARRPSYQHGSAASLPEQSFRASNRNKEEPQMSTAITRGVLQSLVVEDRPWTIEELIREQGERSDVEDAIADLHAAGLLNRINKRVVCASRAAIRADELNS
jgi:hypothetical protein